MKYYNPRGGISIGKGCKTINASKPQLKGSGKLMNDEVMEKSNVESNKAFELDNLRDILNSTRMSTSKNRMNIAKKIRL